LSRFAARRLNRVGGGGTRVSAAVATVTKPSPRHTRIGHAEAVLAVLAEAVLAEAAVAGPRKRWLGRDGGGAEVDADTVAETPFAMYYLFS
jgi:hypothetical protein